MAEPQDGRDNDASEPEPGRVSITVRNSYGTRVDIEVRLEDSVEELKVVIAEISTVPVGQQKLFHKGHILENDRSLGSYGIKKGHTILMLRGSAPTTPAAAESSPEEFDLALDPNASWFGDPFNNEVILAGRNEFDVASDTLTAQSTPHDGPTNPPRVRSESASTISAPNTEPLPNPWANSAARFGPRSPYPVSLVRTSYARGESDGGLWNASSMSRHSQPPARNRQLSSQGSGNNDSQIPPEVLYAAQLSQLHEMGFEDTQLNIRALQTTSGDIHSAIVYILENTMP